MHGWLALLYGEHCFVRYSSSLASSAYAGSEMYFGYNVGRPSVELTASSWWQTFRSRLLAGSIPISVPSFYSI